VNTPQQATKQATKYSITAAHRITGKSRTTIQKHLKQGRLSATEGPDGAKLIDASELIRVYGDECDFSREEGAPTPEQHRPDVTSSVRTDLHSLKEKLDILQEERRREREQLQSQIEHLQEALKLAQEGHNRATLLLENRVGGGDWREAFVKLKRQVEQRETHSVAKAKEEARQELLAKPWWRALRG
jgi:GTP cyclohydrolase II